MKKLSLCVEGDRLVIERVGGGSAVRRRLLEMGFMKGTLVTIVKYAPLQDPMELVVRGFHVSLRVSEAEQIEVVDA